MHGQLKVEEMAHMIHIHTYIHTYIHSMYLPFLENVDIIDSNRSTVVSTHQFMEHNEILALNKNTYSVVDMYMCVCVCECEYEKGS